MNIMNDATIGLDQIEELPVYEVSDEALEAAAGTEKAGYTLAYCSGLSVCPAWPIPGFIISPLTTGQIEEVVREAPLMGRLVGISARRWADAIDFKTPWYWNSRFHRKAFALENGNDRPQCAMNSHCADFSTRFIAAKHDDLAAFLAPDLVKAAIEGRLPHGMASLASQICHRNGRGSTNCSAFRRTDPAFKPSLCRHRSPPSGKRRRCYRS
jgi:hypothetical protein